MEFKTALCLATGESLSQEDVDYCRGKVAVFAVNDAYRLCPWADVFYACDRPWWDTHHEQLAKLAGAKYSVDFSACKEYGLNYMGSTKEIWSKKPDTLATGGNSGFQCLNLAVNMGFRRVILLGYDMQKKNKSHFFGDHPGALNRPHPYKNWIKSFKAAKPFIGAEVINCTRDTALDCFEKKPLREAL